MNKTIKRTGQLPVLVTSVPSFQLTPLSGNILLISQDQDQTTFLCENLQEGGYEVERMVPQERLLPFGKNQPIYNKNQIPDLIICDVAVNENKEMQFLRSLCETNRLTYIPIILLAEIESSNFEKAVMDLWVDDFLIKPVRPAELLMRVRWLLHK